MGKTVISFGLSENEINRAIREINQYKQEFQRKVEVFREKVAERLADEAQGGFRGAIVDDLLQNSGGARLAEVSVSVDNQQNVSLVIASGEDAIWVEFGAGVYHNGSAGSSPHPRGAELGFTIGSFGAGNGRKNVWGFYEGDALKMTHGTPAKMPMYHAVQTVCKEIASIAREVFG